MRKGTKRYQKLAVCIALALSTGGDILTKPDPCVGGGCDGRRCDNKYNFFDCEPNGRRIDSFIQ